MTWRRAPKQTRQVCDPNCGFCWWSDEQGWQYYLYRETWELLSVARIPPGCMGECPECGTLLSTDAQGRPVVGDKEADGDE